MWDCGRTPTRVIEHGVLPPRATYTGELPRGVVVINHLLARGRRLGVDVFERLRERVPLDLVGMAAKELGGIGEIPPTELGAFISRYRFFMNPIRYTSLGLAVCEAMTMGMPVVGLATTEMATAVQNGRTGYVDTDLDILAERMQTLLDDPALALQLGQNGRTYALRRFDIARFAREWEQTFHEVATRRPARTKAVALASI
jgi:glycosyltransferase involved in cell wall biosynthesis